MPLSPPEWFCRMNPPQPPPPPPPFPLGAEVRAVQNGDLIGNDRWQQLEPQGPLMIRAALGSQWTPNPHPPPPQHTCRRRQEAFRADDSSASPAEGPRGYSNVVLKVLQRWDGESGQKERELSEKGSFAQTWKPTGNWTWGGSDVVTERHRVWTHGESSRCGTTALFLHCWGLCHVEVWQKKGVKGRRLQGFRLFLCSDQPKLF